MAPLNGIRVIDLSRVLAGPIACQVLADLGAEVIKIERPEVGDDSRAWAPPYARDANGEETSESTYFQCANRGKRSITIDHAKADGQQLIRDLAQRADVLVENFKAGSLTRYGLGFEDLQKLNPRLVYCSITGYGQDGPYANRPGYDPIAQALGGMMSVTGERDELPGGGPQRPGVSVVDILTGVYGALAVVAALEHRHHSGRGQHIDLALLDVAMATMTNVAQAYLGAGVIGRRFGSGHPTVVPSQIFRTADGHIMMTTGNDAQFERFCDVAERRDLLLDPRFETNDARVRNRDAVVTVVAGIIAMKPREFWVNALTHHGVPCAPINDIAQAFDDPQLRHRGMRVELADPHLGTIAVVGSPMRFSASPVSYSYPPPRLGEHTERILNEWLNLTEAQMHQLRESGAL